MNDNQAPDAITASVIRSAMETICFEMATYVSRTATTPMLNPSNERNATILDASGRLAALSVGIPQFMLSSTLPVRSRRPWRWGRQGCGRARSIWLTTRKP